LKDRGTKTKQKQSLGITELSISAELLGIFTPIYSINVTQDLQSAKNYLHRTRWGMVKGSKQGCASLENNRELEASFDFYTVVLTSLSQYTFLYEYNTVITNRLSEMLRDSCIWS
jgi:ribosome-binding factor A